MWKPYKLLEQAKDFIFTTYQHFVLVEYSVWEAAYGNYGIYGISVDICIMLHGIDIYVNWTLNRHQLH